MKKTLKKDGVQDEVRWIS